MATQREKVVLEAAARTPAGKGSQTIRRDGLVPAIVYKGGGAALPIQVPDRELSKALRTKAGENVLITLRCPSLQGGEGVVLIKELQHHPVTHRILHVDFHQISLTERIKVAVPFAFQGEAIGVRQAGGVLEHIRWELEVECLPTEIPTGIPVDISALELGKTLHVKDLILPPGVKAVTDPEQPVVACVEPRKEEIPVPAAAAEEGAAPAEPEVIKQKKPEEGEEAAAEAPKGKEKEAPAKKEEKAEGKK